MRIATNSIHQLAASDIQNAQLELFEAQRQTGSEKKANDLKGYARDAKAIVFARGFVAQAEAYAASSAEVANRLGTQDIALEQIHDSSQSTRLALTEALALDSGRDLVQRIDAEFSTALGALNMTHAGRYVFGGVRDDQPPVNINAMSDLAGLAGGADAFDNALIPARAQLDTDTSIEVAPLANNVGTDLFDSYKRIYDYSVSIGGFGDQLTAADRTFLENEIQQLNTITSDLTATHAANGTVQKRVDNVVTRQTQERDYFENLSAGLEGIDLAEVASRLTQAQLRMQASVQAYMTLKDTSLLNLLR